MTGTQQLPRSSDPANVCSPDSSWRVRLLGAGARRDPPAGSVPCSQSLGGALLYVVRHKRWPPGTSPRPDGGSWLIDEGFGRATGHVAASKGDPRSR